MLNKEKVSRAECHPFYKWAKETLGFGTALQWKFHKYLSNRHGKLIDYFYSSPSPQSDRLKHAVETALNENMLMAAE